MTDVEVRWRRRWCWRCSQSCLHGHSVLFRASRRHVGGRSCVLEKLSGVKERPMILIHADRGPHAAAL